jgi:hypothetical protein
MLLQPRALAGGSRGAPSLKPFWVGLLGVDKQPPQCNMGAVRNCTLLWPDLRKPCSRSTVAGVTGGGAIFHTFDHNRGLYQFAAALAGRLWWQRCRGCWWGGPLAGVGAAALEQALGCCQLQLPVQHCQRCGLREVLLTRTTPSQCPLLDAGIVSNTNKAGSTAAHCSSAAAVAESLGMPLPAVAGWSWQGADILVKWDGAVQQPISAGPKLWGPAAIPASGGTNKQSPKQLCITAR